LNTGRGKRKQRSGEKESTIVRKKVLGGSSMNIFTRTTKNNNKQTASIEGAKALKIQSR